MCGTGEALCHPLPRVPLILRPRNRRHRTQSTSVILHSASMLAGELPLTTPGCGTCNLQLMLRRGHRHGQSYVEYDSTNVSHIPSEQKYLQVSRDLKCTANLEASLQPLWRSHLLPSFPSFLRSKSVRNFIGHIHNLALEVY